MASRFLPLPPRPAKSVSEQKITSSPQRVESTTKKFTPLPPRVEKKTLVGIEPLPVETKRPKVLVKCFEADRQLVAVPLTEKVHKQYHWPIPNQLYYLSSGTSNESNFPGVYFPMMGISEKLGKLQILKMLSSLSMAWRSRLCRLVNDLELPLEKRYCILLDNFLNKFRYWFQVQQSAALGGEFWQRPDVQYLRDIALNYSWDNKALDFVEDSANIQQPQDLVIGPCSSIQYPEASPSRRAELQNAILRDVSALLGTSEDEGFNATQQAEDIQREESERQWPLLMGRS